MIEHAVMTFLINALWLVPLIAATTGLCTRFGRLGPRGRHGAWIAALLLSTSLPALPAVLLPFHLAPLAPGRSVSQPANAVGLPASIDTPAVISASTVAPPPWLAFDQTWTRAFLCLAGAVVAIALCRLLVAVGAGRRLVRAAIPHDLDPAIQSVLNRVAGHPSRTAPPIFESQAIGSPVVVGAVRPAILVPEGFGHLPWDEQRAALLHEMAHVARRDYAWNLVCEAVSLPLAWHPAILPIKAGIRRSREVACDALAAQAMASPVTYAKCLVSLAAKLGAPRTTPAIAVGLIGKSDLEERLMTLLNPTADRRSNLLRMAGAAGIAVTVLAPAVFLRVTPAFADETVVARRMLVSEPVAPAVVAAPAPSVAPAPTASAGPARKPAAKRVARLASLGPETPLEPPPPPEAPTTFVPVAPPAPPTPPAAALNGIEIHEHGGHHQYDVIVHRALEQALGAEKDRASEEIHRALAEVRSHKLEMVRADETRIHAEVTAAIAELDRAGVEKTLRHLRSRLESPEFQNAIATAARGGSQGHRRG